MSVTIIKGNILHTPSPDQFSVNPDSFLVAEDGIVTGIFRELPEKYSAARVYDYVDCLIIPGLCDIHVHAPQFVYRGLGIDMQLMDWLNTYAFPTEARFSDLSYARTYYEAFADEMARHGTTRAVVFGTIHVPATELLMEILEKKRIRALVGKVNMDTLSPEPLCENAEQSLRDTEEWILRTKDRFSLVKPAVTPRFIPTCSSRLLQGLGDLAQKYDLPIHSHISEDLGEMAVVRGRYPEFTHDGAVYDHFHLLTDKTVMAHFLYPADEEIQLVKDRGVTIACCAQSHGNVAAGVAKTRKLLDAGVRVGLGSDIAGGCNISILRAMSDAIYLSKIRYLESDKQDPFLTAPEVFYMGTMGGRQLFGNVGCFEPGFELDAIVLDDGQLSVSADRLSLAERLERAIHLADDRHIKARFVAGAPVHP